METEHYYKHNWCKHVVDVITWNRKKTCSFQTEHHETDENSASRVILTWRTIRKGIWRNLFTAIMRKHAWRCTTKSGTVWQNWTQNWVVKWAKGMQKVTKWAKGMQKVMKWAKGLCKVVKWAKGMRSKEVTVHFHATAISHYTRPFKLALEPSKPYSWETLAPSLKYSLMNIPV